MHLVGILPAIRQT